MTTFEPLAEPTPWQLALMRRVARTEILGILTVVDEQLQKALEFDDRQVEWEELGLPDDLEALELKLECARLVVMAAAVFVTESERKAAYMKGDPLPAPLRRGFLDMGEKAAGRRPRRGRMV